MRRHLSLFLLLLIGLLAGCSPASAGAPVALAPQSSPTAEPTAVLAPSATVVPSKTVLPPTATRSPTVTRTATVAPSKTPLPPTEPPATPTLEPSATPAPSATPLPTVPPTPMPPTQPPVPTRPAAASGPVTLIIPRIGVRAAIEWVGVDSQGRMAVPEGVMNVAWYKPGSAPGAVGNAVMSGHLDNYKQEPAVFWRLGELEAGDELTVVDAGGSELRFRVTAKEIYPYNQAPLDRIFGYTVGRHLNLITCNGVWDSSAWNYDQRLVVYTEMVP